MLLTLETLNDSLLASSFPAEAAEVASLRMDGLDSLFLRQNAIMAPIERSLLTGPVALSIRVVPVRVFTLSETTTFGQRSPVTYLAKPGAHRLQV